MLAGVAVDAVFDSVSVATILARRAPARCLNPVGSDTTICLKERTVAVEVLGRSADADLDHDSIVRVRAREVCGRLEHYYATEGTNDGALILAPKLWRNNPTPFDMVFRQNHRIVGP